MIEDLSEVIRCHLEGALALHGVVGEGGYLKAVLEPAVQRECFDVLQLHSDRLS